MHLIKRLVSDDGSFIDIMAKNTGEATKDATSYSRFVVCEEQTRING